mgnify:FL=1
MRLILIGFIVAYLSGCATLDGTSTGDACTEEGSVVRHRSCMAYARAEMDKSETMRKVNKKNGR